MLTKKERQVLKKVGSIGGKKLKSKMGNDYFKKIGSKGGKKKAENRKKL